MSRYKDHCRPRRHRDDDEPFSFPEKPIIPSFFQRPPSAVAAPVDAQVKWFNASKGFGFVEASDGTEAYLPLRVLEAIGSRGVAEGAHLKVTLEETKKGHQVAQVLEIGEEIPKSSAANAPASGKAIVRPQTQFATRGTVKWYSAEKGFGFIAPEGGGKDVFVHASALSRSGLSALAEGQKVLFEQGPGKKGLEVQTIRIG